MNTEHLIIRLPREDKLKLKNLADKERTTMSKLIKDFIESRTCTAKLNFK